MSTAIPKSLYHGKDAVDSSITYEVECFKVRATESPLKKYRKHLKILTWDYQDFSGLNVDIASPNLSYPRNYMLSREEWLRIAKGLAIWHGLHSHLVIEKNDDGDYRVYSFPSMWWTPVAIAGIPTDTLSPSGFKMEDAMWEFSRWRRGMVYRREFGIYKYHEDSKAYENIRVEKVWEKTSSLLYACTSYYKTPCLQDLEYHIVGDEILDTLGVVNKPDGEFDWIKSIEWKGGNVA